MLKFDIALQKQLISAVLDDFSPNDALPGVHGGQYGESPAKWREAVIDFVSAMLTAELLTPIPCKDGYASKTAQEISNLLQVGDPDNGLEVELIWDVIHFTGTEKLATVMRDAGLANWEARNQSLSPTLKAALTEMSLVAG